MRRFRLFLCGIILAVLSAMLPASAQGVLATVNGEPITSTDVDQRVRIMALLARQNMSRQQALEQIIDDRLKIIEARRIGYRLKEENLDDRVATIANSNNKTIPEFMRELGRVGIERNAYRFKIRADYSWDLALNHRFKSGSAATSSQVKQLFEEKVRAGAAKVTDYVVHTIIFVVPQSGESAGQRERDAQAARSRFQSCDEGIAAIRQLRDVAIRPPVKRSSDQIPPQMIKLLNDTPVGRLSAPFRTPQGIEMLAVCEKSERVDETSLRNSIENEVAQKNRTDQADEYLKSLRSKAVIQYRGGRS